MKERRQIVIEVLIGLLLAALLISLFYFVLASSVYQANWNALWRYRAPMLSGWWMTLRLSAGSMVVALAVAILLVVGQRTGSVVLKRFCQGYIEFIRGTPLLTQILIGFYVVAAAFRIDDRILVGVAVLSCFSAAYLAEILRGGIDSVASSQREAAKAVGFTTGQTYRFVIVPQAVRRIAPALAGQFANLIKDSSLLMVIGVAELTKQAQDAAANTYASLEIYLPLVPAYLLLTLTVSLVSRWMEKRFAYES